MAERLGLATGDLGALKQRVVGSWDGFLAIARHADPAAPTRLPGWTVREVALHLGRWDDNQPLERILDSARSGATEQLAVDQDALNERTVAAHADASWDDVLAALHRSREGVATFLDSPAVAELGTAPAASVVGPLPVLTILNAGCYELAVHALDIGARDDPVVLLAGVSALADVTGALAHRMRMTTRVTVQTPDGGWQMRVDPDGWDVTASPPGPVDGIAVLGSAADTLDVAAGRAFGPTLLAQRRFRMQDLAGFLQLAPIVEAVPGIPGGAPLRAAARLLAGAGALAAKVPRVRLPRLL